ncbi:heat shock 70 kDa protein 12B-like [Dreissena polymorpha]|uniref:Uncharacterized protein n=1 Tax=Dreissena polymorpha TaxID=45954 RepID=A0A9D4MKH2_DREPO|nr:heat shock 70 kDa protein 12B-like [Dreissena polymorpha]KAH3877654.1 hypothetical protein DPMN_001530 [Dreissena polymorpha]
MDSKFIKSLSRIPPPKLPKPPKSSFIVAAIDFGTTYSGYAFSLKSSPDQIHANAIWNGGSTPTLKAPTCVLLDPKGSFHSFGYEAEQHYQEVTTEGWRLFRRFKMVLHTSKKVSSDSTVNDVNGQAHPALPVFTMAIRYLREHLLKALNLATTGIVESDIRYILTVPAIWDVGAKQFMREAATKAGIPDAELRLALEPEAAAVWCDGPDIDLTGKKFMVIDLGGGTADISTHEKLPSGNFRNLHKPSGGPWGGIYVDECYEKFLSEVFGEMAMKKMKETASSDLLDMLADFETKKRSFRGPEDSERGMVLRIPAALATICSELSNVPLSQKVSASRFGTKVKTRAADKLSVDSSVVETWFQEPLRKLLGHLHELLRDAKMHDIKLFLLVGGFGESKYVKNVLEKGLIGYDVKTGRRLVVPVDAGIAVLKGAVKYGQRPEKIESRVMPDTYGVEMLRQYDGNKKHRDKMVISHGKRLVNKCFEVFVRANEEVKTSHTCAHKIHPISATSTLNVYKSRLSDPEFTTDDGCERMGTLTIKNSPEIPITEQELEVTFMFAETEIKVKVKNKNTGKEETLTLHVI